MPTILRKFSLLLILLTLLTAISYAGESPQLNDSRQRVEQVKNRPAKTGFESGSFQIVNSISNALGFDEINSLSPGLEIDQTAIDMLGMYKMNRLIDWNSNQNVHFVWPQLDIENVGFMNEEIVSKYVWWKSQTGEFEFAGDNNIRTGYLAGKGRVNLPHIRFNF